MTKIKNDAPARRYMKPTAGVATVLDVFKRCTAAAVGSCWEWQGAMYERRPAVWTVDLDKGTKCAVSGPRALWYLVHGQPLGGRTAWMVCGNYRCMCPHHLTSGTRSEFFHWLSSTGRANFGGASAGAAESAARGRAAQGLRDTPADKVLKVVALSAHARNTDIARALDMSLTIVGRILNGRSHRSLTGLPPKPALRGPSRRLETTA